MAFSHRLIELTSDEMDGLARSCREQARALVALLPIGSVEQHGPALPLGADLMLAESICARLALAWDAHGSGARGLVLPALPFTNADSALGFPGTMSVPHDAQRLHGTAVMESALSLPVDMLLVLNAHGPNDPWIGEAAFILNQATLRQHGGRRPPVLPVSVARAMAPAYEVLGLPRGKHADWLELCLVRHAVPEAARRMAPGALARHLGSSGLTDCPFPGVPLRLRGPQGVLGSGGPGKRSLDGLAPAAWDLVFHEVLAMAEAGLEARTRFFQCP